MLIGPLSIFFGEMSIQILCPLCTCVTCLFLVMISFCEFVKSQTHISSLFKNKGGLHRWPQDWKRSVFISKVMLKILQARLQQYVNHELPLFKLVLEKPEEPGSNCQHPLDHRKSKRVPKKDLFLLY